MFSKLHAAELLYVKRVNITLLALKGKAAAPCSLWRLCCSTNQHLLSRRNLIEGLSRRNLIEGYPRNISKRIFENWPTGLVAEFFVCSITCDGNQNLHGSEKRGYFLGSFIPIHPQVTGEKKLTDTGAKNKG